METSITITDKERIIIADQAYGPLLLATIDALQRNLKYWREGCITHEQLVMQSLSPILTR